MDLLRAFCDCRCLLFLVLIDICFGAEYLYTTVVDAGKVECFYQQITADSHYASMDIEYQVIDGGDLDITFYMLGPTNVELHRAHKQSGNVYRVQLSGDGIDTSKTGVGDYKLCFDNTHAYQSSRTLYFEILLYDKFGNLDEVNYDQLVKVSLEDYAVSIEDFRSGLQRLKGNLDKAEQHQASRRGVEAKDRAIMEANFIRVNTWSMFHLVIMLFVLALQVYTVRSLFEENSTVGRLIRKGKLSD